MFALIAFALLVLTLALHEAFHAIVALLVKLPIRRIAIGLPVFPKKTFFVRGTEVIVSPWIFLGEMNLDGSAEYAAYWKKFLVNIGGPVGNIVFAAGSYLLAWAFDPNVLQRLSGVLSSWSEIVYKTLPGSAAGPFWYIASASKLMSLDPWPAILFFWVVLGLGLGMFNLIPVPALDGGRIFLDLYVAFSRNKEIALRRTFVVNFAVVTIVILGSVAWTVLDGVKYVSTIIK